jgi:DNA polymerase elongation subunit (family B)
MILSLGILLSVLEFFFPSLSKDFVICIMFCLVTVKKTEHGKKHKEFCLVSVKKTQQIKQHHKIYVIIITTDLNKEDENIRQIIERHLRKKSYLK